jgi:hypothetical protein
LKQEDPDRGDLESGDASPPREPNSEPIFD